MMAQLCTFLNFECRKLAHTTCQLEEELHACVCAVVTAAAATDTVVNLCAKQSVRM